MAETFGNEKQLNLKRKLVEAVEEVRKKFRSIKNRNFEERVALERIYEPITKPLNTVNDAIKKQQNFADVGMKKTPKEEEEAHMKLASDLKPETENIELTGKEEKNGERPLPKKLTTHLKNVRSQNAAYDRDYGVRYNSKSKKYFMGNAEIQFPNEHDILIFRGGTNNPTTFPASEELYNVIFLKFPEKVLKEGLSDVAMNVYAGILNETRAAFIKYDPRVGLNSNRRRKFKEIILPLSQIKSHTGGQLQKLPSEKLLTSSSVNYIYWNKPGELLDRLRLLWGSKQAGNNAVNGEIMSIIEELKEDGIIY